MDALSPKPLRIQKVEKELQQCISQALGEFLFIPEGALVTVIEVDVASDIRSARVFVSVYPDQYQEEVFEELDAIRADIQKQISKKVRMKFLPKLSWHKDRSVNEIDRIGKILLQDQLEKKGLHQDQDEDED